jgi:DNA-binding NarL/FixJ family response regulator
MEGEPATDQSPDTARLLIAESQDLLRAGLSTILSAEPDFVVRAEVSNGKDALAICRSQPIDLLLIDVSQPESDGIATVQALKRDPLLSNISIVALADNPDALPRVVRAGATGYVLKDATKQQLITTVRHVLNGEFLLSPVLLKSLVQRINKDSSSKTTLMVESITPRETDVLQLLVRGYTNPQIALDLGMSVGTVKVHVEHIIAKLHASSRTEAAALAISLKLVSSPPTMTR